MERPSGGSSQPAGSAINLGSYGKEKRNKEVGEFSTENSPFFLENFALLPGEGD